MKTVKEGVYKAVDLKKVFVIASLIMFIGYGYVFVNYTPTHDGNMIIKANQGWELSCGRFVVWYYSKVRGIIEPRFSET